MKRYRIYCKCGCGEKVTKIGNTYLNGHNPPWNKGTKGLVKANAGSFKKGMSSWSKGTKGLVKANSGSFKVGNIPKHKGSGKKYICEVCGIEFISSPSHERKYCSRQCSNIGVGPKISKALTGRKLTREHVRNCLRRREKSSLEIKFENICIKNNLPYKFVGNGEVMIENKNPDFINCNGKKKAIEVFWTGFKTLKCFHGMDINNWKSERSALFRKYG